MREPRLQNINPPSKQARIGALDSGHQTPDDVSSPKAESGTIKGAVREIGGRKGAEPTRFGDWEKNGRCIDF